MATYYLGWSDILWQNNEGYDKHIYIVKDQDGDLSSVDDQLIIRGTAEHNDFSDFIFNDTGALLVEDGVLSRNSRDGLNNTDDTNGDGYLDNDKNKDGVADTTVDRHYTPMAITDAQWDIMVQFAASINSAAYSYELLGANCQAVVVSALSLVGIDFEQNVPYDSGFFDYVSRNILLSGEGSDTLFGFQGDDTFYDKKGGNDTFYGGDVNHQSLFDTSDGFDTVRYRSDNATGNVIVFNDTGFSVYVAHGQYN